MWNHSCLSLLCPYFQRLISLPIYYFYFSDINEIISHKLLDNLHDVAVGAEGVGNYELAIEAYLEVVEIRRAENQLKEARVCSCQVDLEIRTYLFDP